MRKSALLVMYGISVTLILRQWYKTNSGIPTPSVLRNPSYAFTLLLIASDFMEGLPMVLGAAVMFSLAFQAQDLAKAQTKGSKTTSPKKPSTQTTAKKAS